MLKVVTPEKTVTYQHNAMGNRVAKLIDGTVVEKYLWQNKTTLLAIYDANGNLKQRYEYTLGNTPTAFTQGSNTYYILSDQLGSPRLITDSSGNVVKQLRYDSYGNVIEDTDPTFTIPFGFAGGLQDQDSGLIRFGFRDYDLATGRWTARDPIGFAGGDSNLYGYVLGDPVNFVDMEGTAPVPGGVDLGGGNSVRIDSKRLQPNQKPHAHFETPKGTGVVNNDGTPSHGKKSGLDKLNKTVKKYLEKHGFKLRCLACALLPPDVQRELERTIEDKPEVVFYDRQIEYGEISYEKISGEEKRKCM